jgi:steroid delta-isomerase-like uncharacterized protein
MSAKDNKAVMRRVFEEVINKGNLAIVDEFIAKNYVVHTPMGQEYRGPEGFKQMITMTLTAFPDLHMTINNIIGEDDRVAIYFTYSGTHKGDMMGIAPTGKNINIPAALFIRFANGKEVEASEVADMLGFYQQLGITPPMRQSGK